MQMGRFLGRMLSVFVRMQAMSMRDMGVVACGLVVARISVFRSFPMMLCS
jgi:hypothetical protein